MRGSQNDCKEINIVLSVHAQKLRNEWDGHNAPNADENHTQNGLLPPPTWFFLAKVNLKNLTRKNSVAGARKLMLRDCRHTVDKYNSANLYLLFLEYEGK
jgi:hypothetical protein